jgi:hypothetical protein
MRHIVLYDCAVPGADLPTSPFSVVNAAYVWMTPGSELISFSSIGACGVCSSLIYYVAGHIMQSVFGVAARRRDALDLTGF